MNNCQNERLLNDFIFLPGLCSFILKQAYLIF